MGLNDSLLNVPERLRVWQQAGIRYFYVDPLVEAVAEVAPEPEPALQPAPAPKVASESVKPTYQVADDPASWPKPWPGIFAKAPKRPRIVLTYEALSLDMTGQADPRRGKLWRRLIQELGLSGTNAVAFWPYCLPDASERERDTAIFLAGLRLMQPDVLAIFGTLAPGIAKSWHGHLPDLEPVMLADPERLLGGDMEAWHDAIDALGSG